MLLKLKLEKYLKEYLSVKEEKAKKFFAREAMLDAEYSYAGNLDINTYINENKEESTFQTKLFKLIDSKELKDSEVYNKVGIDRRLFSKIRSDKNYHPSKETIILLGIALELKENEIEDLLSSASYSLPMNNTYDLIIRFCFKEGIYDLNQINDFLYDHHCNILNN